MSQEDCSVCCESIQSPVTCPYCQYLTCVGCQKQYLTSTTKDAHCMSCSKAWDRVTLFKILPRSFVLGDFKRHRENILFEREQGLMPATQPDVIIERVRREVVSLRRGFIEEAKHNAMALGIRRVVAPPEVYQIDTFYSRFLEKHRGQEKKKKKLIRKCPSIGCKGFLNSKWHCELCSKDICKSCNEEKVSGHECDPATVETVKLIRSDTKGCPTCGTLIYRSAGCPQMWCIECHTTFDWNTGEIEKGVIHNPHYYEYVRQHGSLGRNPCDGNFLPALHRLPNHDPAWKFHRLICHIRCDRHFVQRHDQEDPNKRNRIEYMLGAISEDQFKYRIQCNEKAREKQKSIRDILEMFVNVGTDILNTCATNQDVQAFDEQYKWIFDYANTALDNIRSLYRTMVPRITDDDIKNVV